MEASQETQDKGMAMQLVMAKNTPDEGSNAPTAVVVAKNQDCSDQLDVIAKLLSVLAVCQLTNLLHPTGQEAVLTPAGTFIRRMQEKDLDGHKKAELMVAMVLQTVASGPTDAGWSNLGIIVDDIVQGREGALDNDVWFEMAEAFFAMASGAASWGGELLPLAKLQRAMQALHEPLQHLRHSGRQEELAVSTAISLCKAGLFLAVLNQSGRLSDMVSAEGNRQSLAGYEAGLRETMRALAAAGAIADVEHFWQSVDLFPVLIPFAQDPDFRGRGEALEALGKLLAGKGSSGTPATAASANGSTSQVRAVCIWGAEGLGKSQLALEFCYRQLATYKGALWVNASELCFEDSYVQLARHLHLHFDSGETWTLEHKLAKVRAVLEDGREILLVLDNVESEATLARLLPQAGAAHVVVTSRTKIGSLAAYELPPLNFSEGLEVIKGSVEYKEAKGGVLLECVEALHCFPLGLAIASHLFASGTAPPQLLKLLKKDLPRKVQPGQWDRSFRKPSSFKNLVEASLEQLLKRPAGTLAVAMLEAARWFAPHAIPVPLLTVAGQNLRAAQGRGEATPEQIQSAVQLLLTHKFATFDHTANGLVFNCLLHGYVQTRRSSQQARSAVLAAVAAARCFHVTAPHFWAMWQLRRDLLGGGEEAAQITTVGLGLANHWVGERKVKEAIAIWDELRERWKFPVPPAIRCQARLCKARALQEGLGEVTGAEHEVQLCARELPKELWGSAVGLALQVEQLAAVARSPPPAGSKSSGPAGQAGGRALVGQPGLTALQALAFRLSKNASSWDESGPLQDLQAVNPEDALVVDAMARLTKLLRDHKLAPFEDYLGLTRRTLEMRESILPPTDGLLLESLCSLGQLYEELRELGEAQLLLLEAFRRGPRGRLSSSERPPAWVSSAQSLADLHLTHEQRKEACIVYEIILSQMEGMGQADPLGEAHAIADLGLMMQGPLTWDILEKARYNLEGTIADQRGGQPCPLSSERGRLFSLAKAKLGVAQFRLNDSGQALVSARKWIVESVVTDGDLLAQPRPLVALSMVLRGEAPGAAGDVSQEVLRHRLVLLARLCLQDGEVEEAREHLAEALALVKSGDSRGPLHEGRIGALLGAAEWLAGADGARVLQLLEDALKMLSRESGEDNLEVADLLDCIGRVHEEEAAAGKTEAWQVACHTYAASHRTRQKLLGPAHPALAFSLVDMLRAQAGLGHMEEAEKLLQEAEALLTDAPQADLVALREELQSYKVEIARQRSSEAAEEVPLV